MGRVLDPISEGNRSQNRSHQPKSKFGAHRDTQNIKECDWRPKPHLQIAPISSGTNIFAEKSDQLGVHDPDMTGFRSQQSTIMAQEGARKIPKTWRSANEALS